MGDQALASLTTALSGLQVSSRKPELPPFDKTAIDIWIRRVESAFIRSGITRSIEKFAFIESKFAVNEDPAVDKFLFGDPTDENWKNFCDYLKKRHGKTTRQKAAAVLEPVQMDGRTPLQYLARFEQSIEGITLDDIKKEICLRQLPNDIQQTICKATETMSAEELMKYAESFYNPDGSRIHKKAPTINVVRAPNNNSGINNNSSSNINTDGNGFTTPFVDIENETDINAVGGRGNFSRGRQNNNNNFGNGYNNSRSKSRGRSFGNNNNNNGGGNYNNNNYGPPRNNNNNNGNSGSQQHDSSLCFYHNKFGNKAKRCDIGCAKARSGNGPSPRQ